MQKLVITFTLEFSRHIRMNILNWGAFSHWSIAIKPPVNLNGPARETHTS